MAAFVGAALPVAFAPRRCRASSRAARPALANLPQDASRLSASVDAVPVSVRRPSPRRASFSSSLQQLAHTEKGQPGAAATAVLGLGQAMVRCSQPTHEP